LSTNTRSVTQKGRNPLVIDNISTLYEAIRKQYSQSDTSLTDPESGNRAAQHDIQLQHTIDTYEAPISPQRRKRKHHSSTDSSLLENRFIPTPRPPQRVPQITTSKNQHAFSDSSRRSADDQSLSESLSSSSSSSSRHREEKFERRKRHKTREDKYDLKKRGTESKGGKTRTKREKKGDRNRAAKKAGEDLMHKFSSKSIGQERLTVSTNSS